MFDQTVTTVAILQFLQMMQCTLLQTKVEYQTKKDFTEILRRIKVYLNDNKMTVNPTKKIMGIHDTTKSQQDQRQTP